MKLTLACIAAVTSTVAMANQPARPTVPTGIDVPGCTRFVIEMPSGRVRQVCEREQERQANDPNNPLARVKAAGDNQ